MECQQRHRKPLGAQSLMRPRQLRRITRRLSSPSEHVPSGEVWPNDDSGSSGDSDDSEDGGEEEPRSPSHLLNLPIEIIEQIIDLAIVSDSSPSLITKQRHPRGRWHYALSNLGSIWGLRLACRSLYHLTTHVVYASLNIVHLHDAQLYQLVRHLAQEDQPAANRPDLGRLVREIFFCGIRHRRVTADEIDFIARYAKRTHAVRPPPELIVAANTTGRMTFKPRGRRPGPDQGTAYYNRILRTQTPDRVADAILADMLLAMTSHSLENLDIQHDDRLPYGAHLSDDITFPSLQNLAIASEPGNEFYPSYDSRQEDNKTPFFVLGMLEPILRRAPDLKSITAICCGAISAGIGNHLCPRMESVTSLRFIDGNFAVSDFAAIADMCPNLEVFRYSAFDETKLVSPSDRYRGYPNMHMSPIRNRCDRSAFCLAFLPLRNTLRYLDLELYVSCPWYGLDCDLSRFRALEHLCLNVRRTTWMPCEGEEIVRMLPRGIRSVSLLRLDGKMREGVERLIEEIVAGGFPNLEFLGHTYHLAFGDLVDRREALSAVGVDYRPSEVQRVDVESSKRLATWEEMAYCL